MSKAKSIAGVALAVLLAASGCGLFELGTHEEAPVAAAETPTTDSGQENGQEDRHRVLVLNSLHHGYPWTESMIQEIFSTFKERDPEATIIVEHMDTMRQSYQEDEYVQLQYCPYRHK